MAKLAKQEGKSVLGDRTAACWRGELSSAPAVGSVCPAQVWAGMGDAKSQTGQTLPWLWPDMAQGAAE